MADPQVIDATDITIGPEAFGGTYDRTPPPPIVANDPKPLPGPATSYPAGAPLTGGGLDLADPQGLKEITAVATRAQRGKLQAETSAMMEESEQLKKHREAAEHFLEERGNFKMPKWDAEAEREKTTTSPWMALANPGLIISVLAAGKTRMAMTNAMNAAAGSINAIRAGDEKQYQQNFEAFKLNADLAIKQQEMLHTNYLEAMELYKTDPIMAERKIANAATLANDQVTLGLIQQKGPEAFWDIQTKVAAATQNLVKAKESIQDYNDTRSIRAHFGYDEQKSPTDPQNQKALLAYQQWQTDIKQRYNLGDAEYKTWISKVQAGEDPVQALREVSSAIGASKGQLGQSIEAVRQAHPEWTDEQVLNEAVKTIQATKANPAKEAETARHNQAVEAIKARGGDTAAALAEERKRHDEALEKLGERRADTTDKVVAERERHDRASEAAGKGTFGQIAQMVRTEHPDWGEGQVLTETTRRMQDVRANPARETEIARHNKAMEEIGSKRGDVSAAREAEFERHDKAMEALGEAKLTPAQEFTRRYNVEHPKATLDEYGDALIKFQRGMKGTDPNQLMDPQTIDFMARQYMAGDKSVLQNIGRGVQGSANIAQVRKRVQEIAKEQNVTPVEMATRVAEFNGMLAAQRTLGTRTANVEMFNNEALNMFNVLQEASNRVPRTSYVPVNKALLAWEKNTGDPDVRAFGAAINTAINTYAKAIAGGGQATVSDKEHAREILSMADSPEQVDAVIGILKRELEAARTAPGQVKQELRELSGASSTLPSGSVPAPTGNVIRYDAQGNRVQ